jgi:nucleoside-diphosphate-sugar epimerase
MISVFGARGFIGSKFHDLHEEEVYRIPREQNSPTADTDVLYLISTTHNYHVFDEPYLDVNTNLIKLIAVLEEFKDKCQGRTFNFISSWFVYGDTDFPAREDSICNPKGFYSITKQAAERIVASYCETFGISYRILRLCNVYGESATGVSKKRNALQFMIRKIINGEEIGLYDDGQNVRDFMHVEDVCRAIMLCMDKAPTEIVLNIGSGIPQTFRPLMEYVKEKTESTSPLVNVEPPHFHKTVQVRDMYLDVTLLKSLGFRQKIGIYEGIDRIIKNER